MAAGAGRIVVVGASLAGHSAVAELRAAGYDGDVVVVGKEDAAPYDRPPLSKGVLSGEVSADDLALGEAGLATWRLGRAATGLDLAGRRVILEDGEPITYDGLVIATGATPRALAGAAPDGVHTLRMLADALALRADLRRGPAQVAVIGGGFIGCEIAATCRAMGIGATIVEPLPGLLHRVLGPAVAQMVEGMHRDYGVALRLGVGVSGFVACADGALRGLRLTDGSVLEADVAVVAIGVAPETGWLRDSGLDVSDGVLCDATCRAAPGVVAAGDIARWPNPRSGETRRVEHWDNARRQGRHAARRLLAGPDAPPEPYAPVPWVWSDQFGAKLQIYGSTAGHDTVRIVSASAADGSFVALYRRAGRLAAVAGLRATRSLLAFRRRLEEGALWEDVLEKEVAP